ncbi:MAG: rhodanese-like domain-containing protein [Chlorobi bacterium]|nr:rhodanese-like domain-containing protein [Chlorobiota bacterium]
MSLNKFQFLLRHSKIYRIFILFYIVIISFSSISCSNSETENHVNNSNKPVISDISVVESYNLIKANSKNNNFVILDIRTPGEYNSGYIENAVNIDFYNTDFLTQLNELDKTKKYLIYCRSGNRSGKALAKMKELGFKEVYNMLGGIIKWNSNSYPLVK